jgi:hypothetical protein
MMCMTVKERCLYDASKEEISRNFSIFGENRVDDVTYIFHVNRE